MMLRGVIYYSRSGRSRPCDINDVKNNRWIMAALARTLKKLAQ